MGRFIVMSFCVPLLLNFIKYIFNVKNIVFARGIIIDKFNGDL